MSSSPAIDAAPTADDCHEDRQGAAGKRKRNLPGTPDPDAEVIALSPKTLMATNRFLCEVCGKGFQRDQNLQLHRRGHNLPWKLKQRDGQEVKRRVYVCPEPSCIHHDPSRALGDLTGIKKHFSRKHGEKKWKCEKCSKQYAVHSDWKAHLKVCGTREYRCDCGTLFSRRDSFVTHRAFCDALAQEHAMAAAHRLAETQQSSDTGGNAITSPARDLSSVVDASPLPLQQQAGSGRPSSDFVEPLGKEVWEASSAVTEYKGPKGLQCELSSTSNNPIMGPGLSLSLGTGLGPGPPCPSKFISSLSRPLVPPLSNMMNQLVDTHSDGPAKIPFSLPLASAGMYTNLLAAASSDLDFQQFEKGAHGRIGDVSLSMAVSTMTDARAISQFANSTYSNSGIFSAKHQRQHTGSAQLPATTLLQKAAIMGVTKSNPFLFESLGDLCSISFQNAREHNAGAGATTSSSSSWHALKTQQGVEGLDSNYGSRYAPEGRQYFSDGSELSRLDSMPSGSSSSFPRMKSAFLFDGQPDHETGKPSELLPGRSGLPSLNITTSIEVEETQQGETGILTLDFLGIGDRGSLQGGSSSTPSTGARPGCVSRGDDT